MPPEELPERPGAEPARPSERIARDNLQARPWRRPLEPVRENREVPPTPAMPPAQPGPPPAASPQPAPLPTPSSSEQPTIAPPPPPTEQSASVPGPAAAPKPQAAKNRRRFILPIVVVLVVLLAGAGTAAWLHEQAIRNNPDTALQDALLADMTLNQVQVQTNAGVTSSQVLYDFSTAGKPLVSNQATITLAGSQFQIAGYGSLQNTYVSYTKLPAKVSPAISSAILNAWVQLRSNGTLPTGVNPTLANVADPRYQSFGLVVVGNYPLKTRQQVVNFLVSNKAYAYDRARVTHTVLSGVKVLAYPVTLNTGFIKVANQSVAVGLNLTPADVQAASDALNAFRGAKATLYIDVATHHIRQLTVNQNGQTTTYAYSHFNNVTLPNEPATKLTWQEFSPLQAQLEAPAHLATAATPTKK